MDVSLAAVESAGFECAISMLGFAQSTEMTLGMTKSRSWSHQISWFNVYKVIFNGNKLYFKSVLVDKWKDSVDFLLKRCRLDGMWPLIEVGFDVIVF